MSNEVVVHGAEVAVKTTPLEVVPAPIAGAMSADELIRRVAEHKTWVAQGHGARRFDVNNRQMISMNLSRQILKQASFFRCLLIGTKFDRANMESATLNQTDVSNCDFEGALLSKADFHRSIANKTCFGKTNLTKATFLHADLTDAYFVGADLTDANFKHADMTRANLTRCCMTRATLPTGESWEVFLYQVVPYILEECGLVLSTTKNWDEIPAIYHPRIRQFVLFYINGLISERDIIHDRVRDIFKALPADLRHFE